MTVSKEQIASLISLVTSTKPDDLDCDGCHGRIAEFAELHLASKEVPVALQAVERHLQQCLCCKDEYGALLKALRALEE